MFPQFIIRPYSPPTSAIHASTYDKLSSHVLIMHSCCTFHTRRRSASSVVRCAMAEASKGSAGSGVPPVLCMEVPALVTLWRVWSAGKVGSFLLELDAVPPLTWTTGEWEVTGSTCPPLSRGPSELGFG